jgi:hypothetical protein
MQPFVIALKARAQAVVADLPAVDLRDVYTMARNIKPCSINDFGSRIGRNFCESTVDGLNDPDSGATASAP